MSKAEAEVYAANFALDSLKMLLMTWEMATEHQEWLAARAAYYELLKELGGEE